MSTRAENYCQGDDENSFSINPDLEERSKGNMEIELNYDSVTVSKDNMPYGEINATLELKDNNIVLHMKGKEYDIQELLKNVQEATEPEVSDENKELINTLLEQQKLIKKQRELLGQKIGTQENYK